VGFRIGKSYDLGVHHGGEKALGVLDWIRVW